MITRNDAQRFLTQATFGASEADIDHLVGLGDYATWIDQQWAEPANNIRPDENFAREVLQLFSIGLVELQPNGVPRLSGGEPIPTFDQDIVEEFARVFTGWTFGGTTEFTSNDLVGYDTTRPMEAVVAMHDSGAKTLLGGQRNPAGLSPAADIDRALDNIFAHANVGPFISRFLIQRLVTSNPSPGYVGRVAAVFNNDGSGTRGNLGATVKAILLDPDARNGANIADFGKVKEPLMRFTQLWRAMHGYNPRGGNATWRPPYTAAEAIENVTGQAVMRSPSVFNFFQPNHSPPGTPLLAPEMQIHTEAFISEVNRALHGQVYGFNNRDNGYDAVTRIDVEREVALAGDVGVLVDHLDDLLLGGLMPPGHRQAMQSHLATIPNDADGRYLRALDAIFMVVGSPAFMVQPTATAVRPRCPGAAVADRRPHSGWRQLRLGSPDRPADFGLRPRASRSRRDLRPGFKPVADQRHAAVPEAAPDAVAVAPRRLRPVGAGLDLLHRFVGGVNELGPGRGTRVEPRPHGAGWHRCAQRGRHHGGSRGPHQRHAGERGGDG